MAELSKYYALQCSKRTALYKCSPQCVWPYIISFFLILDLVIEPTKALPLISSIQMAHLSNLLKGTFHPGSWTRFLFFLWLLELKEKQEPAIAIATLFIVLKRSFLACNRSKSLQPHPLSRHRGIGWSHYQDPAVVAPSVLCTPDIT